MPIYEYRCSQCGHELEALQKLADARLTTCPACHATTLVKQLSAAGFQLKGSGWYATDFRGGGKSKPAESGDGAKAESAAESTADSSADSDSKTKKSDTKSDTKSDSKPASEPSSGGKGEAKMAAVGCGTGRGCH